MTALGRRILVQRTFREDAIGGSWPFSSSIRRLVSDHFDNQGTPAGSARSAHRAEELPLADVMRTCRPADPSTG